MMDATSRWRLYSILYSHIIQLQLCTYNNSLTVLNECDALIATKEAVWSTNP